MPVRIRIDELMRGKRIESAYQLVQAIERTGAAVSAPTVYRLVKAKGAQPTYRAELLTALAEVFGIDVGALFETSARRSRR